MTITAELIKRVILEQREDEHLPNKYIHRLAEGEFLGLHENREIIVITGIRRCGKSVLMQHVRTTMHPADYYCNFEDERLVNFSLQDFQTLQEVFIELYGVQKTYYFDEIQNIPGWEMFIRRLYNGANKIYLTGSNANLFSEELGTRLTGRYIAVTMYPVSFFEFVQFNDATLSTIDSLTTRKIGLLKGLYAEYMMYGGIPEYLKYKNKIYMHDLYESILYKDIIARYKIPDPTAIKKLLFYLASNCGKEITYSALRKWLAIGSVNTVSDYCSYIENSFLCFFVNRYSDSIKAQQQAPKKVYFIDHALAKLVGFRNSEDYGRLLENLVFLELRRRNYEIYYHKDSKECDFVLRQDQQTVQVIQVCKDLSDPKTKEREIAGLLEAMRRFSLDSGMIITDNDKDDYALIVDGKQIRIEIKPIWSWLLSYKS